MARTSDFSASSNDAFNVAVDQLLARFSYTEEAPWSSDGTGNARFHPDVRTLENLLSIPAAQGTDHTSGRLGKALDAWVAHELRRCGFEESEIFPYRCRPRVLPPTLRQAKAIQPISGDQAAKRAIDRDFGRETFEVVGEFYTKQIDVFMGEQSRGPELMVSTKSMSGSWDKNIKNRYEEFLGDAENLRTRFPLATLGVLYAVDSAILETPDSFRRLTEMLLRLQRRQRYDVTLLIVMRKKRQDAVWGYESVDSGEIDRRLSTFPIVSVDQTYVPHELSLGEGLSKLVGSVLERIPSVYHPEARRRRGFDGFDPE